jgi:orotate phosphoribosyltransferase
MALDLIEALLQTEALRIAPAGEPFWYTSGTVGPYYVNTHFLFGGSKAAGALLEYIDGAKADRDRFPAALTARLEQQAARDPVYAGVIEALVALARAHGADQADGVSGGERRDWFFSPLVAARLAKPHLWIYKDLSLAWSCPGPAKEPALAGQRLVHVADLITEASSYLRGWIPAIAAGGGAMAAAVNVVDRAQGGAEALAGAGVPAFSLLTVDEELFAALRRAGRIDEAQQRLLLAYYRDPYAAMRALLQENAGFLRRALASPDRRTAERARLLVAQNPYDLDLAALIG